MADKPVASHGPPRTAGSVVGALDVGGTKLLAGLITADGRLLAQARVPTEVPRGPLDAVERIVSTLKRLLVDCSLGQDSLSALGCSVPGPLDRARGVVVFSPNLQWYNFPLRDELSKRFPIPIAIDDDANCAALAEGWRGAGRAYRHFLYVTVSTGIGAGLVLDGRLYHGAHDGAGEIGHTVVEPDGPPCSCGGAGCLEALASGTAITGRARDAVLRGDETAMRAMVGDDPGAMRGETVFAAASRGDAVARAILHAAGAYLGIGLANLATLLDPEAIVGGGGVIEGGDAFLLPARVFPAPRAANRARHTHPRSQPRRPQLPLGRRPAGNDRTYPW